MLLVIDCELLVSIEWQSSGNPSQYHKFLKGQNKILKIM